jgi:hypothetical protein
MTKLRNLYFTSTKKELFPYLQGNVGSKFNSSKHDQLLMYASWLLIKVERNYNTTKKETLTMVFTLHKFTLYLLAYKFVFYIYHMVVVTS